MQWKIQRRDRPHTFACMQVRKDIFHYSELHECSRVARRVQTQDIEEGFFTMMASHISQLEAMQPEGVLGPVPEVDVMAKRPQGLLNVGALSARMAVLRSCALDI
jgi:hypothetical protein